MVVAHAAIDRWVRLCMCEKPETCRLAGFFVSEIKAALMVLYIYRACLKYTGVQ